MEQRKDYEEKLDSKLREWSSKIDVLIAKADKAAPEAKKEYYKKIEALRKNREIARIRVEKLKSSDDDAWESLRKDSEEMWEEFKNAFEKELSKVD
jgi:hypothetical protein